MTETDVTKKALTVYDQVQTMVVVDNITMIAAVDVVKAMRLLRKEIASTFDPIISKAHAAHQEAKAQKDKAELPLIQAEDFLKPRIKSYLAQEELKRQAEENRIRLEAQKAEEEIRLAEAVQLASEGLTGEAEYVLESPKPIMMPTIAKTVPKVDMRLYRKIWKYRILRESDIPREYLTVDLPKIGAVVRALKSKCKIPGVEIYEE
jgi:hypothetical protein